MAANRDFVDYCLELLSCIGPCTAKRMFGGWGLALDGLNLALIADLGANTPAGQPASRGLTQQRAAMGEDTPEPAATPARPPRSR